MAKCVVLPFVKILYGKFLLVFLFFDSKMSMDKNFHSALRRSKQWDAHCDFCMPPVAILFLMFCLKTKTGWQQLDSLTFKYFIAIRMPSVRSGRSIRSNLLFGATH